MVNVGGEESGHAGHEPNAGAGRKQARIAGPDPGALEAIEPVFAPNALEEE